MAIDQAVVESVDRTAKPTLRFYSWNQPALSLGYFQHLADRDQHGASTKIDCVRRSTGGGAIIHHHELTYSLSVPNPSSAAGPRIDLYQRTHQCLVDAIGEFGIRLAPFRSLPPVSGTPIPSERNPDPFLCFQRRTDEDLIIGGYKVVGSAQRKSRSSVLQHGSVLLQASEFAPELPGINDLSPAKIDAGELAERVAKRLAVELDLDWVADELNEAEQTRSHEIVRERFGNPRWQTRR